MTLSFSLVHQILCQSILGKIVTSCKQHTISLSRFPPHITKRMLQCVYCKEINEIGMNSFNSHLTNKLFNFKQRNTCIKAGNNQIHLGPGVEDLSITEVQ